jgi:hypothetical protein
MRIASWLPLFFAIRSGSQPATRNRKPATHNPLIYIYSILSRLFKIESTNNYLFFFINQNDIGQMTNKENEVLL